jgi:hypothetical protein
LHDTWTVAAFAERFIAFSLQLKQREPNKDAMGVNEGGTAFESQTLARNGRSGPERYGMKKLLMPAGKL